MATPPTTWSGTARVPLLTNANIPGYANTHVIPINPATPVTWTNGISPPGGSTPNLGATYPSGYAISYLCTYEVSGYMYCDPDRDSWMNVYTNTSEQTAMYTFVPQPIKNYWNYGPDPSTQLVANSQGLPKNVSYNFFTSDWTAGHYPMNFTWVMNVAISVSSECTQDNIHSQVCQNICNINPSSQQCYFAYQGYCLNPDAPENLADPICTSYLSRYIATNNSNGNIDAQAIRYCKKYTGFADLFQSNANHTDLERAVDTPICSCFLSAPADDPNATELYDVYQENLAKVIPQYGAVGIKNKCLVPQCASASFLPSNIPARTGGCPVPKCINTVVINNDGTINSIVTQSCGADPTTDYIVLIVVMVILVILAIVGIAYYFYTTPSKPRKYYPQLSSSSAPIYS